MAESAMEESSPVSGGGNAPGPALTRHPTGIVAPGSEHYNLLALPGLPPAIYAAQAAALREAAGIPCVDACRHTIPSVSGTTPDALSVSR